MLCRDGTILSTYELLPIKICDLKAIGNGIYESARLSLVEEFYERHIQESGFKLLMT